jgi:predicted nucleic acid-binding Zn ribbon protein
MTTAAPQELRCPGCGRAIAEDQSWCLECGTPARTRIAPTPPWRRAIALIVLAVALALTAIGFGIAELVSGDSNTTTDTTRAVIVTTPAVTTPALTPSNASPTVSTNPTPTPTPTNVP